MPLNCKRGLSRTKFTICVKLHNLKMFSHQLSSQRPVPSKFSLIREALRPPKFYNQPPALLPDVPSTSKHISSEVGGEELVGRLGQRGNLEVAASRGRVNFRGAEDLRAVEPADDQQHLVSVAWIYFKAFGHNREVQVLSKSIQLYQGCHHCSTLLKDLNEVS